MKNTGAISSEDPAALMLWSPEVRRVKQVARKFKSHAAGVAPSSVFDQVVRQLNACDADPRQPVELPRPGDPGVEGTRISRLRQVCGGMRAVTVAQVEPGAVTFTVVCHGGRLVDVRRGDALAALARLYLDLEYPRAHVERLRTRVRITFGPLDLVAGSTIGLHLPKGRTARVYLRSVVNAERHGWLRFSGHLIDRGRAVGGVYAPLVRCGYLSSRRRKT